MSVTGSTDLGGWSRWVTVDHDPTIVATDTPEWSIIVNVTTGDMYRKDDDGSTTNVTLLHAGPP